ncbi:MAG TPA: addiction module toxin RelE [Nitrospirae bacterium]|nr:addiction module toxin RelE [Nitrospirota bacterium]
MARPLRIEFEGAVYHITSRGNERKDIFQDDEDRKTFLDILQKVILRYNWLCHAYCLMSNHYHLVIETPEGNLSKGMRQLNGVYTQLYNRRHNRVGHLFQGRYKAILIEKESHLLEVCRYVVLNPVRAAMAKEPGQWRWSSFRATAAIDESHPCLTTDWILGQFGRQRKKAINKYIEFVMAGTGTDSIWKNVKGQIVLGRDEFVEEIVGLMRDKKELKEIPRRQRHLGRPLLEDLLDQETLRDRAKRGRKIYEAVMKHGYSQKDVAEFVGLHYSRISRIVKKEGELAKGKT